MLSTGKLDGNALSMPAFAREPSGLMIVPGAVVRVQGCLVCKCAGMFARVLFLCHLYIHIGIASKGQLCTCL